MTDSSIVIDTTDTVYQYKCLISQCSQLKTFALIAHNQLSHNDFCEIFSVENNLQTVDLKWTHFNEETIQQVKSTAIVTLYKT